MTAGAPALAVVLARGGSRGLPNKNALPCAGRPMLAWTLEHALGSASVGRVALGTDSAAYAKIAAGLGVGAVLRPAALATDCAPVAAAAHHAATAADPDRRFALVAVLYGNVPVRPADLTDRVVGKLGSTGCDSVQSVSPVGKHHPFWMKALDGDRLRPHVENDVHRRQDLPPLYELDGGALAVPRAALDAAAAQPDAPHAFLGTDRRAVVNPAGSVVDVDSEIDRLVAEAILSRGPAA
ncbi:acylneuraminate cytidylyltransferase family protein [Phycisphaera mikurensis]|uniref:Putative CMP-sialic acid synthase n=1 Tax=Phycisphaera mikurensis (strain NBRC 102666 / KCTC 22515 / FYK2301M01) TaxID=1142394 RepID=I0IB85_PHYMF|nr:NTP transferase domain-containing protein [Phycisphaera mikurensis]MBB6443021.1 CMP-N-acetylneuraminic acid synthetase [Phycisphaera mikurensis]BAM02523.1 putative CMP-sialic acid synthase [Phycisphaera mikurensis NBRC 102666]